MKKLICFLVIVTFAEDVFCILKPCQFFRTSQPLVQERSTPFPSRNYGPPPPPKPNYGVPITSSVKPETEEITTPESLQRFSQFEQKLPLKFKYQKFRENPTVSQGLPFRNSAPFNVEIQKSISLSFTDQQLPFPKENHSFSTNGKLVTMKPKLRNQNQKSNVNVKKPSRSNEDSDMKNNNNNVISNVPTSSTFVGRLFLLRNDGQLEPVILRRIIPQTSKDSLQNGDNISASELTLPFRKRS